MNFRTVLFELLTARPDLREDPFLLYDTVCTRLGDDPDGRRAAKNFYEVDRRTSISSFLSENTSQAELEDFCRENGVGENKTWGLLEALFGVKKPPKPTLSELDDNVLLFFSTTDPLGANPYENHLHIDFDCKHLAGVWGTWSQPWGEIKQNPTRPWKLCPLCANATQLFFQPPRKRWWEWGDSVHLNLLNEQNKKALRKARGDE